MFQLTLLNYNSLKSILDNLKLFNKFYILFTKFNLQLFTIKLLNI